LFVDIVILRTHFLRSMMS